MERRALKAPPDSKGKRADRLTNWFIALAADTFSLQATSCPHACKHAHLCPFPSQRNQACARTGSFHGSPVPWRSRVRGTGEKRAVKDNLLSFSFTHKAHQLETNLDLVTAGICVLFYSTCFSELYISVCQKSGVEILIIKGEMETNTQWVASTGKTQV